MNTTQAQIDAAIRQTPLLERLERAKTMIRRMCSDLQPPKMSIPVQATDEDMFIIRTLEDAIAEIERMDWALNISKGINKRHIELLRAIENLDIVEENKTA